MIIEKATCKKVAFVLLCMYAKKLHKIKMEHSIFQVLSATHKELTPYSFVEWVLFILELQRVKLEVKK